MSVVNDLDQRFVTLYPKATNFRHYIKISRYNCYRYSASVLMYYIRFAKKYTIYKWSSAWECYGLRSRLPASDWFLK